MIQAGQLLSNMWQQARTSGSKQVELSPNQVVKGTIVKVLPEQTAIVQIGGMQMVAKMETNLEAGQKAWLQVQGNTEPLTLKVVHTEAGQASKEASQEGLLRSFGLPNQPELKEALQFLLDKNLPVNKQTLLELGQIIKTQGSGTDVMQSVQTALTKQLPLTQDVVLALRSFLFGNNISDSIRAFLQQVNDTLATLSLHSEGKGTAEQNQTTSQGGSSASTSSQLQQPLRTLATLLQSLPLQLNEKTPLLDGSPAMLPKQVIASLSQTSLNQTVDGQQMGIGLQNGASPVQIGQQAGQQTNLSNQPTNQQGLMPSSLADKVATLFSGSNVKQGVNTGVPSGVGGDQPTRFEGSLGGGRGQATLQQTEGASQSTLFHPSGTTRTPIQPVSITGNGNQTIDNVGQSNQNSQQQTGVPILGQNFPIKTTSSSSGMLVSEDPSSLKQQSLMNNQAISAQAKDESAVDQPHLEKSPGVLQQKLELLGITNERNLFQSGRAGNETIDQQQLQNIKSLLLQITQAPQGVSLALKEASEQLLQHITGQQLMMSTSQQTQPLTHVMMQIPIKTEQGEDTAFVQVEARKQKSGQLDPGNCRLFFQLDLHVLGMTMVDVTIVNRITTIQVYNDQSWLEKLIQSERQTFTQQLQEVGYQLSILRVQPLPDAKSGNGGLTRDTEQMKSNYIGVDLRV
ncbi:hypothetical protein JNUCC42_02485 [Brevibacterium sp. JNUCC-42]|nr:hypothetical protein JNUCC42_02485 [Brevibacterium sp. JNUCC-42]